jgi:hypothetical protein
MKNLVFCVWLYQKYTPLCHLEHRTLRTPWTFRPLQVRPLCCLKKVGPLTQWCGIRHQRNTIICYTAAKNLKTHICILHLLYLHVYTVIFFYGATTPSGAVPPHYQGFMLTLIHTTLGRTPMNEWTVQHREIYSIHDNHKRQTCQGWNSNPQS